MSTIVKPLALAGIAFSLLLGSAGVAEAKDKENCYFHHRCPADGIHAGGAVTKAQCKKHKSKKGVKDGLSWGAGPTSCEDLKD